jgi:hypothetical protein
MKRGDNQKKDIVIFVGSAEMAYSVTPEHKEYRKAFECIKIGYAIRSNLSCCHFF